MGSTDNKLDRFYKFAISISFVIAIMYFARAILIPLAIALFFSMLLYPVAKFLENHRVPRSLSITIVFLGVLIIVGGTLFFFGTQFFRLFQNIRDFGTNIESTINNVVDFIEDDLLMGRYDIREFVGNGAKDFLGTTNIIEKTIASSTSFLATLLISLVYTFLFLLYRGSFKEFILIHFREGSKMNAEKVVNKIQKVSQNYFYGLILIILILGTLNGTGLWLIGLDYPYLFGFFAALLAIIPYIGTFIGGLLPTLYALINYENIWTALLVVIMYVIIQAVEGNILTPNIVGSKVSLNPLFALLALFVGGLIWGVAGMILFIPLMAILKVILDNMEGYRPYGVLLGSRFGDDHYHIPAFKRQNDQMTSLKEERFKDD